MPGMATSRTRHLVSAIDLEARNSSADENVCASKPNSFSKSGKDSRTDSSSSTTVIRGRVTISYDSQLVFSSIERWLPRMRLSKPDVYRTLVSVSTAINTNVSKILWCNAAHEGTPINGRMWI